MSEELEIVQRRAALATKEPIRATLERWETQGKEIVELAGLVPSQLKQPQDALDATNVAQQAKALSSRIDAQRKTWGDPFRHFVGAINARCKALAARPLAVEESMKERLAIYAEGDKGQAPPKVAGASFRDSWQWEVTDMAAIPREFLTVDDRILSGLAKGKAEPPPIPGIRWVRNRTVAIRKEAP